MMPGDKNLIFKYTKLIIISLSLLVFCGCKTSLETKHEILSYINDEKNGLTKSSQSNGVDFKVNFLPWQVQTFNKNQLSFTIDEKTKSSFKTKYYFLISFSKGDKELLRQLNANEYSELVQILAFRMSEFVKIKLSNGKVIEPLSCLFQQTYGLSKANQLLVIFDCKDFKKQEKFKILINEFGLRTGDLLFSFSVGPQQKLQQLLPS